MKSRTDGTASPSPADTSVASADLARWVATWRRAGGALARLKREELERLDTSVALRHLADAFEHALRTASRTTTSGLVDQQRVFQRLAR